MKLLSLPILLIGLNWSILATSLSTQSPLLPSSESASTKKLLSLHRNLIEHQSISGNELSVGKWLTQYLESHKFTVETQKVEADRYNIFAYLGKTRKTRTLVSSHIDTVPPYWPYERRRDEIWGRGSVDAKGSVATQIMAVLDLIEAGTVKEGDVSLLFVVGEEVGGEGMKKANDLGLEWETAIFGEPTELKLASGHKGMTGFNITAKGKAGHSGYPELGKSANAMIIPALNRIMNVNLPWSEKYGNTTLNIGKIEGGVAANVIAENAYAVIAIRIADGGPEVVQKILLDAINEGGEEFEVVFRGGYAPVYIDSDVPGFETIVVNYGTDIIWLKGDHKRYLYGPGTILMAHSDHEHLKISDLEEAVEGYKKIIEFALK